MSVRSTFFIATTEEMQAFKSPAGPPPIPPGVLGGGVNYGDVLRLRSIVDGSLSYEFGKDPADSGPDLPALFRLPADLLKGLATARPERLEFLGRLWVVSSPPREDEFTPGRVEILMRELGLLARQAVETGRDLFLFLLEIPGRASLEETNHLPQDV